MKLTFIGAARTTTGSKTLIETREKELLLVDCGLFQGFKEGRLKNWEPFPILPSKIDKVLLTHAHLDHTGYLPLLVKQGFRGKILASEATRDLAEILLRDAGKIQEEDARRANRLGYSKHKVALPLYTEEEAIETMRYFETFDFGKSIEVAKGVSLQASRAGHILGSSFLSLREGETTVLFSGDLGRKNNPVLKDPAEIQYTDILILESTYGNRLHPEEDPVEKMSKVVQATLKRGGTLVIPSFAVGRTQIVLWILYQLKKRGELNDIPIYLDSPMAQDATGIFQKYTNEHSLTKEECREVCRTAQFVKTVEESKQLHATPYPKIIIAASGMVEGGRVLHHISKYGPDHHNTILFVGYQARETRGDKILRGAREVKIFGNMVPIRAHIEAIESLSSHADLKETLEWLGNFKTPIREVFLNHGEEEGMESLKEKIEEEFGWKVTIPYSMDAFEV